MSYETGRHPLEALDALLPVSLGMWMGRMKELKNF